MPSGCGAAKSSGDKFKAYRSSRSRHAPGSLRRLKTCKNHVKTKRASWQLLFAAWRLPILSRPAAWLLRCPRSPSQKLAHSFARCRCIQETLAFFLRPSSQRIASSSSTDRPAMQDSQAPLRNSRHDMCTADVCLLRRTNWPRPGDHTHGAKDQASIAGWWMGTRVRHPSVRMG